MLVAIFLIGLPPIIALVVLYREWWGRGRERAMPKPLPTFRPVDYPGATFEEKLQAAIADAARRRYFNRKKYVLAARPSPAGPLGMTDAALARVLFEIHDEQEHPKDIESEGV